MHDISMDRTGESADDVSVITGSYLSREKIPQVMFASHVANIRSDVS